MNFIIFVSKQSLQIKCFEIYQAVSEQTRRHQGKHMHIKNTLNVRVTLTAFVTYGGIYSIPLYSSMHEIKLPLIAYLMAVELSESKD